MASPNFLFRVERDPDPDDEDRVRALDDFEIADDVLQQYVQTRNRVRSRSTNLTDNNSNITLSFPSELFELTRGIDVSCKIVPLVSEIIDKSSHRKLVILSHK